jgi:hypothetical protein
MVVAFFLPLTPFLVHTVVMPGGTVSPPASTRAKAAPTASSPEACQVVISSNSLMVSGCLRLNSWTRVQHIVPSHKAEMTSGSATLGSAWHLWVKCRT